MTKRTDNEKRARLDEELKVKYPDYSYEQIVAKREELIKGRLNLKYTYPLPQKAFHQKYSKPLSYDLIANILSEKEGSDIMIYLKYFLGAIAFSPLLILPASLITLPFLAFDEDIVTDIVFCVSISVLVILEMVFVLRATKAIIKDKHQTEYLIKNKEVEIKCYPVLDTGTIDPEIGDESSFRTFYLVLRGYNEENKGHYPCSRYDYESYRENDFIGMLYLKGEKKPRFTFHLDEWDYDEEMKSVLEKEIQKYK